VFSGHKNSKGIGPLNTRKRLRRTRNFQPLESLRSLGFFAASFFQCLENPYAFAAENPPKARLLRLYFQHVSNPQLSIFGG
jgi:hypothetical protein